MRQWRDRENGERDFLSLHFRIFSQFSHSLAIFSLSPFPHFLSISSPYEVHSDKTRQLTEEKGHMEMFVTENGSIIEARYGQIIQR